MADADGVETPVIGGGGSHPRRRRHDRGTMSLDGERYGLEGRRERNRCRPEGKSGSP